MQKLIRTTLFAAALLLFGVSMASAQTYEIEADSVDITPQSGQTDAQCFVQRSTGELVFFNSDDGGIFSWDGSSLTTERASGDVNSDISGESNTIDRCDGVAVDASDNVYFLFRASGSSSQNSWPTYVYKLPNSGSPSVLTSEDGLQAVTHNNGTVYLAGNEFRGAPEDGFYSVSETGTGQSLTTVVQNADLDLDYGLDVADSGNLYAFSGGFAGGNLARKIVRVVDPSGSATFEEFMDPYGSGSPLIADSGNDIEDLNIVTYQGTEYIVVYNGSFQAQNGDQWGTIQISDQSIELLFNRSDLLDNIPQSGYTSSFTRPMAVNSSGELFVGSRFRLSNNQVASTDYIAKVSDAPPLPVEMSGFDAVQNGSSVELRWQTASETNNAGFRVQRATESGWSTLGFVESKAAGGTTAEAQSYRYTVKQELAPGTHRFRLKQEDLDGSTSLSDVVKLDVSMDEALSLSAPAPNPAHGQTTLSFGVKQTSETTIGLYNVLGQRVKTLYRGTPQPDQLTKVDFDVSTLPSGMYFVRMQADGQTQTQRLTVVK
jgi:hypothetical protein